MEGPMLWVWAGLMEKGCLRRDTLSNKKSYVSRCKMRAHI